MIGNTKFLLIGLCFIIPACKPAKNEAQRYYDTVKAGVHDKIVKIEDILKTAADLPETDLQKAMSTGFAFPADLTAMLLDHAVIRSKLYPLEPGNCLIADVESRSGKERSDYWPADEIRIDQVNIQLNGNDTYTMLLKDSISDISVGELQNNIAPFQQCKYLVVLDCMNTLYPAHVSNAYEDKFEPGALIKKVVIYSVDTKAIVDSFHLYSTSSKKVKVKYGGGLQQDVVNNFTGLLEEALFK